MKAQGIQLASERSVRRLSGEMLRDNLAGTKVPLSQPLRFGVDLKVSSLVYVPDLVRKIFQLLEQNLNARYIHITCIYIVEQVCLIMNKQFQVVDLARRPHADTVKLVFQLCNVPSPNSVQNTCVFAVFEGRDAVTNLHIGLNRYSPQFEHLVATVEVKYSLIA